MLRNVLMRCHHSKLTTFICMTSLCINVFLLISSRHVRSDLVKYTIDASNSAVEINHKLDSSNSNISNDKLHSHLDTSSNTFSTELSPHRNPENESGDNYQVCTMCPFDPPNLLGNLSGMAQEMDAKRLALAFPDMKAARLKPRDCVARQRIAIIIPYRNRYPHLHILLHNLIPFLTRQQVDATFFVIEQAMPETFNRGALLNVGFLEADKMHQFDCYIFHDVDLIPLNDRHLYRCGDDPKHFAVAMNKYKFKLPYKDYFGGAVGFSRRQFLDINGCSNVFFGWGGEDDELKERVLNKGYTINRSPVAIARYDMIKHSRDKGNEANPVRKRILSSTKARQEVEGLNTIIYKVNSVKLENFYIWINVTLNRTDILRNTPSHILEAILPERDSLKLTLKPRRKTEETMQTINEAAPMKNEYPHRKDESVQADSNLLKNVPAKESADNTKNVVKS